MNSVGRLEYVALRLARRFLLPERTANRLARWLPYYRPSVNESQPLKIVDAYDHDLGQRGLSLRGADVVEVGAGRTNIVARGICGRGAASAVTLEPYVDFDMALDERLARTIAGDRQASAAQVRRVADFGEIADCSTDLIVSNSVLEHVANPAAFFRQCKRILRPNGAMLHRVDYRDHFFKYPYAFLEFSDITWERWLNPGDLPRWRMSDHVDAMEAEGFSVDVVHQESLPEQFAAVRLTGRFASMDPAVAVTQATLLAHPTS